VTVNLGYGCFGLLAILIWIMGRGLIEENMADLNEEVQQLRERLQFFEQLGIMGKLILCAVHELIGHLEEIEDFLSVVKDEENDPATRERNLTEALKNLDTMSRTMRSLLSITTSFQY